MKTFRARLILWNVILITGAVVGFGILLMVSSENQFMAGIDRDLIDRAGHAAPPRGDGPRGQGQPGGNFEGGGPEGMPQPAGQRPQPAPNANDVRLPRWVEPDGHVGSPAGPVSLFTEAGLEAARRGRNDVRTVNWLGRRLRVATVPIGRERPPMRVGQTAIELTEVEAVFVRQRSTLLLLLPVAMVAAAIVGLLLANRALRPVEAMADAAAKIGEEDLSRRLPAIGDDEMAQLARTFNGLIGRLQESFNRQKLAYEKLESSFEAQRQFTADASHELRTPLTRMKLVSSAALSQNVTAEEKDDALKIVDRTADEMTRLVQDLLDLARADASALTLELSPVDLRQAGEAAADEFRLTGAPKIIVEGSGRAAADGRSLHRILRNLIGNAVRHTPEYGLITVRADGSSLAVSDTGEGIAPEHLPRIAERFYRGDADRSRGSGGTGLGLAITKTLVEAQNGTLEIASTLGEGTRVTVRLQLPRIGADPL